MSVKRSRCELEPVMAGEYERDSEGFFWPRFRTFWLTQEERWELYERGNSIEAAERILDERLQVARSYERLIALKSHRDLLHDKHQWACMIAANRRRRMLEALATPTKKASEAMERAGMSSAHHSNLAADKIDWDRTKQCGEHLADAWEGFSTEIADPQQRADELLQAVKPFIGEPTDGTDSVLDMQEVADILAKGTGSVTARPESKELLTPSDADFEREVNADGSRKEGCDWHRTSKALFEMAKRGSKTSDIKPTVYTLDFPTLGIRVDCENPEAFIAAGMRGIDDGFAGVQWVASGGIKTRAERI